MKSGLLIVGYMIFIIKLKFINTKEFSFLSFMQYEEPEMISFKPIKTEDLVPGYREYKKRQTTASNRRSNLEQETTVKSTITTEAPFPGHGFKMKKIKPNQIGKLSFPGSQQNKKPEGKILKSKNITLFLTQLGKKKKIQGRMLTPKTKNKKLEGKILKSKNITLLTQLGKKKKIQGRILMPKTKSTKTAKTKIPGYRQYNEPRVKKPKSAKDRDKFEFVIIPN